MISLDLHQTPMAVTHCLEALDWQKERSVHVPDVLAIGALCRHAGWLYGAGLCSTHVMSADGQKMARVTVH